MTNEERRKEFQRLADRHQNIVQCQVNVARRYQSSGYKLTPDIKEEFDRLIAAEALARADYNAASVGWHEPVYVTPIR